MKKSFRPYEAIKIHDMLFTPHNTPHITLGNEQCLKLLLGVCNTKKRGDLSLGRPYTCYTERSVERKVRIPDTTTVSSHQKHVGLFKYNPSMLHFK